MPLTRIDSSAAWHPILAAAAYRFAWFDGLNRFYIAAERWDDLSPHFILPPNLFDDFERATPADRQSAEARFAPPEPAPLPPPPPSLARRIARRLVRPLRRALGTDLRHDIAALRQDIARLGRAVEALAESRTPPAPPAPTDTVPRNPA